MPDSLANPYAAPASGSAADIELRQSVAVPWIRWLLLTAIGQVFLTVVVLKAEFIRNAYPALDMGFVVVGISLVALAIASIVAGWRYSRRSAILLMQPVNLIVWISLLCTVIVLYGPPLADSEVFVVLSGFWAVGAITVVLGTLVSSMIRETSFQKRP